jgi:oligopeptide/dipeptide ABC transporter ATP-binding protein
MPGVSRSEIADRVGEAMEAVGLRPSDANRYPHMFSGGQKQRIVIARAIVLRPSLLILDEPTSALDVSIQVKILNLLKGLQESLGLTYVLISHDIRAVQAMADQVAVMYRGRIVEMGPTAEVIARPVHPYTQHLIASVPVADPAHRVGDGEETVVGPASDDGEDLSVGCPYRVRCPLAEQPCFEQRPPLLEVAPGHLVACPPGVRGRRPVEASPPA